jgi:hypothetical protein
LSFFVLTAAHQLGRIVRVNPLIRERLILDRLKEVYEREGREFLDSSVASAKPGR